MAAEKGHGGGWALARGLDAVTLLDVHVALGEPPLFNIGSHARHPDCFLEQDVDARPAETLGDAGALVRHQFAITTIADLADDFERSAGTIDRGALLGLGHLSEDYAARPSIDCIEVSWYA